MEEGNFFNKVVKVTNKKRKHQSLFKHLCHWEIVEVITILFFLNYFNPK
jgi:hypothetical protein